MAQREADQEAMVQRLKAMRLKKKKMRKMRQTKKKKLLLLEGQRECPCPQVQASLAEEALLLVLARSLLRQLRVQRPALRMTILELA